MADGTILLVDDDESVLVTMKAILELDGYAVTAVRKGASALAALRARQFDLVLTDLRLEDLDGLVILAEAQRAAPETVTVMLTGYASLESAVQALREGAYAYLIKPCNVDELRATIARGMERRRLTQQLQLRVEELVAANRTIQRFNVELHGRVAEATAQLRAQMDELARTKEELATLYGAAQEHVVKLEELDRLKSQFLSMASHELKTPLTSISGFLQLALRRADSRLRRGYPNREAWDREAHLDKENAELLYRQTKRLSRLVNELLDVSRIQTGRLDFTLQPVDLRELVAEAAAQAQATTTEHQVTVQPGAGDATVVADRDHVEQVLSNLLGNAVKYSPDGGPIVVSVETGPEAVAIRVRDHGVGIAAEQQAAIFDLFYRSPDAKTRAAGGMGLGLYISNEIVKRHGGAIGVESEPGEGSAFLMTLPRRPGRAGALGPATEGAPT